MRWVPAGALVATVVLVMAGVLATAQPSGAAARAGSDVSALPSWLHKTVHATAYVSPAVFAAPNTQSVGARLPRSDVTTSVSDGGKLRLGLATVPSSTQTYPVLSTDGGSTWKIDGPLFHVDALQGASVVGRTGALRPHGAYFWGRGGNVIWITYDLGAHWWRVGFGGGVDEVSAKRGTLEAVAFGNQVKNATAVQRFLYTSTDSGRTWKVQGQLAMLRTG